MFKFRTGVPWRDIPERFGPWQTVHGRFARWAADGTFDRLLAAAQGRGLEERGRGRSRGGLTRKIHLACDGRGRPLAFTVTAGTRNDCTQAGTVHRQDPRHAARTGTPPRPA